MPLLPCDCEPPCGRGSGLRCPQCTFRTASVSAGPAETDQLPLGGVEGPLGTGAPASLSSSALLEVGVAWDPTHSDLSLSSLLGCAYGLPVLRAEEDFQSLPAQALWQNANRQWCLRCCARRSSDGFSPEPTVSWNLPHNTRTHPGRYLLQQPWQCLWSQAHLCCHKSTCLWEHRGNRTNRNASRGPELADVSSRVRTLTGCVLRLCHVSALGGNKDKAPWLSVPPLLQVQASEDNAGLVLETGLPADLHFSPACVCRACF